MGVLQTKVTPAGYILPTSYTKYTFDNDKYGFRINDRLVGNLHHHLFNFKVDIDVNGVKNRYQTLNIEPDMVHHFSNVDPHATWYQKQDKEEFEEDRERGTSEV